MRRSAGDGLPTLALPSLAGSAGEAVDETALHYLLQHALAEKEEEESEEKRKWKKEAREGGGSRRR